MMIAAIMIVGWFLLFKAANKKISVLILILVMIGFISMIVLHPRLQRTQEIASSGEKIPIYEQLFEMSGRGDIWMVSLELIRDQPILGVGIGDVNDALSEKYKERDMLDEAGRNLNCHNQFIEIWLSTGLLGFIWLIIILIYPLLKVNSDQKYLYGSFLIICLIGFLFESVLSRVWGVAFFSIFFSLLIPERQDITSSKPGS